MGPDSTDVADLEVDRLVLGHYQDVWGVAAESVGAGPRFISCGHDGTTPHLYLGYLGYLQCVRR